MVGGALRRLNAAILHGLEDDEGGEYRRAPVTVGGVFEPFPAEHLPALVRELVDWLGTDDGSDNTLVRAGLTHLLMECLRRGRPNPEGSSDL